MHLATTQLAAVPAEHRDSRILALCDQAITSLNEARDVEEVFGIRNAAEAFATYTRKMKAAVEAQNQCQLVVLLAEARIGAELKAAQERGEVAAQHTGRPLSARDAGTSPAKLAEVGLSSQRASEMKKLAEAGESRIKAEVTAATAEQRRPSRRNILQAIPAIAERPPELTQFTLWLRSGAGLLPQLGAPADLIARFGRHGMTLPTDQLGVVAVFLSHFAGVDA